MKPLFKINIPVRFQNIWFWVGLIGLFFTSIGVDVTMLTSWDALRQAIAEFLGNPFLIGCAVIALLGQFVDPTTAGLQDSDRAMSYVAPGKTAEDILKETGA